MWIFSHIRATHEKCAELDYKYGIDAVVHQCQSGIPINNQPLSGNRLDVSCNVSSQWYPSAWWLQGYRLAKTSCLGRAKASEPADAIACEDDDWL